MTPEIIERHSEDDINVRGIVQRIINHLDSDALEGLKEITILDNSKEVSAFGIYKKAELRIMRYDIFIHRWEFSNRFFGYFHLLRRR